MEVVSKALRALGRSSKEVSAMQRMPYGMLGRNCRGGAEVRRRTLSWVDALLASMERTLSLEMPSYTRLMALYLIGAVFFSWKRGQWMFAKVCTKGNGACPKAAEP